MYKATTLIEKALKKKGIKCSAMELASFSFVESGFEGKNTTVKVRFISVDNDNDVKVLTETICKIPERKKGAGAEVLNELNHEFRYVKFSMNSDGDVTAQYDFPLAFSDSSVGDVAIEVVLRVAKVVDDAYPRLMRIVWG